MTETYVYNKEELVPGNRVCFLAAGPEIFPELLRLISQAKHRVFLQMYRFEDDTIGKKVAQSLIEAKERGCEVKLIYDHIGSFYTPRAFFSKMRAVGIEVLNYHSLFSIPLDLRMFKRNHRKFLLVDAEILMIGGFNIADDYVKSPLENGYHDVAVRIEGPACQQAYAYFKQVWNKKRVSLRLFNRTERRQEQRQQVFGKTQVLVAGNDHFLDRWRIRRDILYAFSQAREHIYIINPYFLPDPAIIRAILQAKNRGVEVEILIPRNSDIKALDLASTVVFHRLLKEGVGIYRWNGFTHAKAIEVDHMWSAVGSYNFDYRSVFHNLESMVYLADEAFSVTLGTYFQLMKSDAKRVTTSEWEDMRFLSKLSAKVIYRFRAFL